MDRKSFAGTGILTAFLLALSACTHNNVQPAGFPLHASGSDLHFSTLSTTWDEAMPLGNAVVGALIWQKGDRARFSLDRIDLWDQRPVTAFQEETFSYAWLTERLRTGDYGPVAGQFENPEGQGPAPSKIPGAALEFHSEGWGAVTDTRLYLHEAACSVTWENGVRLLTFTQADAPVGWFIFEQVPDSFQVDLLPPAYRTDPGSGKAVSSLQQLGYEQGEVTTQEDGGRHRAVYHQRGYGDFHYDVAVEWRRKGARVTGAWSVTSSPSGQDAGSEVEKALRDGPKKAYRRHLAYWTPFWERSTVTVPDTLIQHQYDRELYKFGSATRSDSYPISPQSVWTADDGQLPPWKGDYHHDLNTQLSYWPAYKGNHLEEGLGYLNTLWNQRDNFKSFTKRFFGKDGLAAPGYSTLDGYPMPGWVQYGFSQTTAAWLAQHFYLHWKYSADTAFLRERAYPFLKDVAVFLEQMSVRNEEGFRTLAYSASPEFNDNRMDAWFTQITNFDLALMRFTFTAAAQMAEALDLDGEAGHWSELAGELPPFALDEDGGLSVAPGIPYAYSHRHFSHAMAIHPLGGHRRDPLPPACPRTGLVVRLFLLLAGQPGSPCRPRRGCLRGPAHVCIVFLPAQLFPRQR